VVEDCSSALELNNAYLKVLVRRSQALEALEKYDEALSGESTGYPLRASLSQI
jgi:hypothetical protein